MSATDQRLTWDEFSPNTRSGVPVLVRLNGEPPVDLFVDQGGHRLGLRVALAGEVGSLPSSPFVALGIQVVHLHGGDHLEVTTAVPSLHPYFFNFARSVADAIQLEGLPPDSALVRSLRDWRALFEQLALLSLERQLGLFGELWLLDRLTKVHGVAGLDAWTGPSGEAHDFRMGTREFEVKATSGEHRVHMIASDNQLTPSPGHDLYLVSLQFASGGTSGDTLRDRVQVLRSRLAAWHAVPRFEAVLEPMFGPSLSELNNYPARVELRSRPYLVAVAGSFPRVTRADLLSLPHAEMTRVSDLRYRLDVDGLGWEDGSPEFLAVLPGGGQ